MAGVFHVNGYTSPEGLTGRGTVGGIDTVFCYAENQAQAEQMAKAQYSGDPNAQWTNRGTSQSISTDISFITFTVHIEDTVDIEVSVSGTGQTLDQVGTALAAALNATTPIANAAYDTGTNVLTIAGAADTLGDKAVTVTAEYAVSGGGISLDIDVSAFFWSTVVDEGASGDALSAVLVAGIAPGIKAFYKQYA